MRIQHLLDFTEHHRYYCYRDFSLSAVDFRMLSLVYKPIVGAFAISLYEQLVFNVPDGKTGYSNIEPHRKLILGLGLPLNESSRTYLIEQFSKLEAIGLLQTSRVTHAEYGDFIYEYELWSPLSPNEFFQNMHFTMILRDTLGKYAVIEIREQLNAAASEELLQFNGEKEDLSIPFYEIFQLNAHIYDEELEQALQEVAPARQQVANNKSDLASAGYSYGEIILRFPKNSTHRYFVEQLKVNAEQLAQINYVAYKYSLSIAAVCRLLDEDGVFESNGELDMDTLQKLANQWFRQEKKHGEHVQTHLAKTSVFHSSSEASDHDDTDAEEQEIDVNEYYFMPVPKLLEAHCDIQQYNTLMRNEPHIQFLKRYFPGQVPDWILNVFERIDLHYKLPEPVINVLIHYGIGMNESGRVTKAFLDSIASNMLMKGIDSYEKAVQYVRDQQELEQQMLQRKEASYSSKSTGANQGKTTAAARNRGNRQKPIIPTVSTKSKEQSSLSPTELEELRALARKIDNGNEVSR